MKRLLAFAGAGALLLLATGLAMAHTVKSGSRVTADFVSAPSGDRFEGKVRSRKNACERRRKVKVFEKRVGRDDLLGSDRTNADGKWQVEYEFPGPPGAPPPPGAEYYAKAKKKVRKHTARHRHICKRAKSDDISFGPPPPPPF